MALPGFLTPDRPARIASLLGVCLIALVLLGLSIPRFMAALAEVPGNPTWRALQDKRPVARQDLERLVKSREQAAWWSDSGYLRADLALVRLLIRENNARLGLPAGTHLQTAMSDLTDSLSRAPANPYAWARLALARRLAGDDGGKAARALALSFLTGPHEPELIGIRTRLTFDLWPMIFIEDRPLMVRHIRYGFGVAPRLIAGLANNKEGRIVVREALADQPGALKKFEDLIRRPRS